MTGVARKTFNSVTKEGARPEVATIGAKRRLLGVVWLDSAPLRER